MVLAVILTGFFPILTEANTSTVARIATSTKLLESTLVYTLATNTTETESAFGWGGTQVPCGTWVSESKYFNPGSNLNFSYQASGAVNVYLFDNKDYSAFINGTTPYPEAAVLAQSAGVLNYHFTESNVYFIVIYNKMIKTSCPGGAVVSLQTASGMEVFQQTTFTLTTQTSSTYSTSLSTSVETNTSYRTLGWLCYIFRC